MPLFPFRGKNKPSAAPQQKEEAPVEKKEETRGRFHPDMIIGEVLQAHPEAEKVIEKYFGAGCFTCPGMRMESLSFGAMMHGIDPEVVVRELNELK
jgi:hybrid cluster-associated redox disulfide protein